MRRFLAGVLAALLVGPASAQQAVEPIHPPPHTAPWPNLGTGHNEAQVQGSLILGPELQRARPAREMLAERRKLDAALAALQPQRPGTIDAYVVAVALDSDPVFSREAREAGTVLSRRYGAAGRTITLAGPDGRSAGLAKGSLTSLTLALARIAELMDPAEDVLVLYSTSHGGASRACLPRWRCGLRHPLAVAARAGARRAWHQAADPAAERLLLGGVRAVPRQPGYRDRRPPPRPTPPRSGARRRTTGPSSATR